MELSPDEKARIYTEEQQRIAAEQYRKDVRKQLQAESPRNTFGIALGIVAAIALVAVIISANRGNAAGETAAAPTTTNTASPAVPPKPPPPPKWVGQSDEILNGDSFIVPAGSYVGYPIHVPEGDDTRNYKLKGKFFARGGSGNDIRIVVAQREEFLNWINGHAARVFHSTPQLTTGTFEVRLPPGEYTLGFSNRFSSFTAKTVGAMAFLDYDKLVPADQAP